MKITVFNLRSITGPKTVDVTNKIVLSGINGAGKSTIAKTPYFVLTGKGLSVKNGETEGYGSIEFGDITIMRQKKNGTTTIRVNGKACSETAMFEHLNKRGYNPEVLCSLFDTETVLDGETMLRVASMKLDVDKVLSFTNLEGVALGYAKKYFVDNEIEIVTIPAINKAYKKIYALRTDNNRVAKNLKALVDADFPLVNVTGVDIAALVEQSTNIEKDIEVLTDTIYQIKQETKQIENLKNNISKNATEKQRLLAFKCSVTEEDIEKIEKEIENKQETSKKFGLVLTELNEKQISVLQELSQLKQQEQVLIEQIKTKSENLKILKNTKTCPLNSGIPCTTDMSSVCNKIEAEIDDAKNKLEKIVKEISDKENSMQEIKNTISETKQKQSLLSAEVNEMIQKRSSMEKERTDYASISGKIETLEKMISEDKAIVDNTTIQDIKPVEEELTKKREEKNLIKEQILNSSRVQDAANRLAENQRKLEEAEKLSDMYSVILKELQILPNKIFEKIIVPIEVGLNGILSEIKNDWQMKFLFDGANLSICVNTPCGKIDIEELSTGERVVINYVFKALICKLINFDTIVLDNTDALDSKNYGMVEDVVAKSQYNTMLINCGDITSKFTIVKI